MSGWSVSLSPFAASKGHSPPLASRREGSGHHYDPNQPRVPAGHPDGGQWTDGLQGGVHSDFLDRDNYRALSDLEGTHSRFIDQEHYRVLSDLVPDDFWTPGARYASRRVGGPSGLTPTPGQLARLAAAEARASAAIRHVQERDPSWRPSASIYSTVEGRIAAIEASAREAEARLRETMRADSPGPFARGWSAAPGPDRHFTDGTRREINLLGREFGCHTCGTKEPGTRSGNFVPDHQRPTVMIREGEAQRLYPQCVHCSRYQGYLLSPRSGK